MPHRYIKRREGGQFFLVWNMGFREKTLFRTPADYKYFVRRLQAGSLSSEGCSVVGYCLLRDQFHLVLEETTPGAIARFMHRLSVSYATHFNATYKQKGKVFAGPYKDAQMLDDEHLVVTLAKLAKMPQILHIPYETYKWSSLGIYAKNVPSDWLLTTPVNSYFCSEDTSLLVDFTRSVLFDA